MDDQRRRWWFTAEIETLGRFGIGRMCDWERRLGFEGSYLMSLGIFQKSAGFCYKGKTVGNHISLFSTFQLKIRKPCFLFSLMKSFLENTDLNMFSSFHLFLEKFSRKHTQFSLFLFLQNQQNNVIVFKQLNNGNDFLKEKKKNYAYA